MSSFNTFQVIIIKSHLVNNDAAALTLASFKRSHLVWTSDEDLVVINHFRHSEILTLMTFGESESNSSPSAV